MTRFRVPAACMKLLKLLSSDRMRVAIIDMGTNTFHLLVAEVSGKHFHVLHEQRQATRIGMGGINSGLITEEAMARALHTLKNFKRIIDELGVTNAVAFGTSAVRNASNAKELVDRIQRETGIETKIISGEEEASLIYEGIKLAMELGDEPSLVMDIGGGSVEFIIGHQKEIFWKRSFEIGGQRLLEKFKPHDPIRQEEIDAMHIFFREQLAALFEALTKWKPVTLIGSSGSFDTFSEIHCLKKGMTYPSTPETPLTFEGFNIIHQELISKDRAQRMQIPGMIELRVDMIVVASCLVKFLITNYSFQKLRVSSFSLKEGILSQLLSH
jgi:exopolyphosphatase/guanosine-5'-triphosphate,3'-diphosphate pyrophosphatase